MSKHPGVDQTLALVESLKGAVRDFAAREERVKRDFETKLTYERQRRDEATEEAASQLQEQLAQEEARFRAVRDAAESKFQARRSRVKQAHQASQRDASERIEANEGRRKHKLQTETLQSRRTRETELANAEGTLAEFRQTLAEEDQALAVVEFRCRRAFGGYRRFLRLLAQPPQPKEPDLTPDEYRLLDQARDLLSRTRADLSRFGRLPLPWLFRFWAVWLVLLVCVVPMVPLQREA